MPVMHSRNLVVVTVLLPQDNPKDVLRRMPSLFVAVYLAHTVIVAAAGLDLYQYCRSLAVNRQRLHVEHYCVMNTYIWRWR
jgi:hypothetical protein